MNLESRTANSSKMCTKFVHTGLSELWLWDEEVLFFRQIPTNGFKGLKQKKKVK